MIPNPLTQISPLGFSFPFSSLSFEKYSNSGTSTNLNSHVKAGPPTCPEELLSTKEVANSSPVPSVYP